MKECILYKKEKNHVKCLACSHYCIIPENKTGICQVRKNINNKLFLLVYGKVISHHIDPIEKKPLYHFLPGTNIYSIGTIGCNFKCDFCQNYEISQEREISGEDMQPEQIVKEAIKNKCKSIAYTYNEPVIMTEFAIDIAKLAKKSNLKNIYVTNGYETKECIDFISNYIDAMNIDLKSFSNKFYLKNCKAKLQPVLNTIKYSHEKGIWIEITTLIIPGENDSEKELNQIAKFISSIDKNIPWHISRFFPMYKMQEKSFTPEKTLQKAYEIGKKYLNHVYIGNINKENNTICPKCKKEIIERHNYITISKLKDSKCPYCNEKIAGVFE
ncbi:AmmeMemoRadiSam system radical SAM enzyme [Candidatus Woesearchaeota archaeon]|nr:AmmeMemoRadiSam system radical SAM enzyme [Candidatus Woesearchaeota archaeon]